MLKKISFLVVVFLTTLFLVQPATKPARAAVLTWEPMVNGTFPSGTYRSPGFDDENNLFSNSTVTFGDYVYVSNLTAATGTEVWRSSNGTSWERVNLDNFGETSASSYAVLAVFNGNLYAFNSISSVYQVDVFRYESGTTWTKTATIGDNDDVLIYSPYAATSYNGSLYVGLYFGAPSNRSVVYKSAATDDTDWSLSGDPGFGSAGNLDVYSLATFNNKLYAGTFNIATGTEIWVFDGATWVQDNDDGFGSANNANTATLNSFGGALYASTWNDDTGAEVWKTTGGGVADWIKVSDAGFGQGAGTEGTFGSAVFKGKLYIGAGATDGAIASRIFRSSNGTSWEQVNDNGFGYADNTISVLTVLGDYLYAATGNIVEIRGFVPGPQPNTTEVYRYYEPTEALPATGFDSPLHAYILDALL